MKNLLVIIVGLILFISCKTETLTNEGKQSNQKTELQDNKLIAIDYSVNPETVKAGEHGRTQFCSENRNGRNNQRF